LKGLDKTNTSVEDVVVGLPATLTGLVNAILAPAFKLLSAASVANELFVILVTGILSRR
jgi:hypothetical protein